MAQATVVHASKFRRQNTWSYAHTLVINQTDWAQNNNEWLSRGEKTANQEKPVAAIAPKTGNANSCLVDSPKSSRWK